MLNFPLQHFLYNQYPTLSATIEDPTRDCPTYTKYENKLPHQLKTSEMDIPSQTMKSN